MDFLYDPGSPFTMIPKHIYHKKDEKPALCPINNSEVAFVNIAMGSDKGQEFSVNYEPFLVSSDI